MHWIFTHFHPLLDPLTLFFAMLQKESEDKLKKKEPTLFFLTNLEMFGYFSQFGTIAI